MSEVQTPATAKVAHRIESLWCDVHGVWLSGWAQVHGGRIDSGALHSDSARVEITDFCERPDVKPPFPPLDGSSVRGFSAYLPCPPFRPVMLHLATPAGSASIAVTPPPSPREPAVPASFERFIAMMKQIGGTVLEIGARVVGPDSSLQASRFQPECRFIGCDIHDAEGVDVVADAHYLSQAIAPGTLDGVFSKAVLEHIAAPWLLAAEINKVLRIGGLTFHALPQTFPVHEMPNDFWRMTDEALKVLFSPALGFEVIEAGMAIPMQILPPPSLRNGLRLRMPQHPGFCASHVIARKVADIPEGTVRWPMRQDELQTRSIAYPAHNAKLPSAADAKAKVLTDSSATTMADCLVCQAPGPHRLSSRVDGAGSMHFLYRCEACDSRFYDPVPQPDYHRHTNNTQSIRAYVESGAGIIVFVTNLAPVMEGKQKGTFLDIGCGYGFAVDFVRQMYGWDVLGVEPSQYGAAGSAALGFPLYSELLSDPAQLGGRTFDAIHSSEVIEHVTRPLAFLELVRKLLRDDGTFVMTTPSSLAADDPDLPWARKMAALSPGFHTCLMSKKALEDLLRRAGFAEFTVRDEHGSLRAYASPTSLRLKQMPDARELYQSYLESGVARTQPGSSARMGFFSRLFEALVGAGAYDRALRLWHANDFDIPSEVPDFPTFEAFLEALPCGAASLVFTRAVCALNYEKNPKQAAQWFGCAVDICKAKIKVAPRAAVLELALFWNARFHEALAAVMAGEAGRGRRLAAEIVQAGGTGGAADAILGLPADSIRERARNLLA